MAGEQQHFVPRFLLKNFTHGKKPKICVYDKWNDNCFQTNIKNVAVENGFYDVEFEDNILTLEPGLAHLETNASGIIKKLVKDKAINVLNGNEVVILAVFLAVQFVRTKEHRLRFKHLGELFAKKLKDLGAPEQNMDEVTGGKIGVSKDKLFGLKSVIGANGFVPHFLNKEWVIFETTRIHPFYISDNPISLHNEIDHGFYGNLGLAVKGIEIYMPLSSTLCLGLLCPTIAEEFRKGHQNIEMLDRIAPSLADSLMKHPIAARAFCEGLVHGTPIKIIEDNVTMINSLQVVYSSRHVYCETDNFELVRRMIVDNKKYRYGLKPTLS